MLPGSTGILMPGNAARASRRPIIARTRGKVARNAEVALSTVYRRAARSFDNHVEETDTATSSTERSTVSPRMQLICRISASPFSTPCRWRSNRLRVGRLRKSTAPESKRIRRIQRSLRSRKCICTIPVLPRPTASCSSQRSRYGFSNESLNPPLGIFRFAIQVEHFYCSIALRLIAVVASTCRVTLWMACACLGLPKWTSDSDKGFRVDNNVNCCAFVNLP